ncbi:MAG: hypothetical protein ACYSR7_05005, partial [Planctomycetota bacterium]
ENGRIVETGQHQKLLANGGLYKKLFEMQFNANEMQSQKPDVLDQEETESVVTEGEQLIELDEPTQKQKWP